MTYFSLNTSFKNQVFLWMGWKQPPSPSTEEVKAEASKELYKSPILFLVNLNTAIIAFYAQFEPAPSC